MAREEEYFEVVPISNELGHRVCQALPFFYTLSGCDTVSSVWGKGKCKAFDVWMEHKDELTQTFCTLAEQPSQTRKNDLNKIVTVFKYLFYGTLSTEDFSN